MSVLTEKNSMALNPGHGSLYWATELRTHSTGLPCVEYKRKARGFGLDFSLPRWLSV